MTDSTNHHPVTDADDSDCHPFCLEGGTLILAGEQNGDKTSMWLATQTPLNLRRWA